MDRIFTGNPLCCLVNAEAGLEEEREIRPASRPKRVMVVGAGPAGMEAARVAAAAGHSVDLYERGPRLGGQVLLAGSPPGRQEFLSLAHYYEVALTKAGVRVHTGEAVDLDKVREDSPDALIVAEGAVPVIPKIPGVEQPFVITSWDFLCKEHRLGKRVAVIGGGAVGLETALLAAKIGTLSPAQLEFLMFHRAESDETLHELLQRGSKEVTVFEMLPRAGQDVGKSSRWVLMKELKDRHVTLRVGTRVESIEPDGTLVYTEGEETRREPFDTVILAVGSAPLRALSDSLREAGIPFETVGDCNSPRKVYDAVHEGYLAGVVI